MLDRLDAKRPDLRGAAEVRVLDVGCGTGSQTIGAVHRWPGARVTGLDASEGMLMLAREARRAQPPEERSRLEFVRADAAALPFSDERFDLLISAFVLQLVPDRGAVLREMHRVLRPGGLVALATWLQDRADVEFKPEQAFEDAIAGLGVRRPERDEQRAGDFESVRAAAAEVRAAGFRAITARRDALDFSWTPESYATYKRASREADLFDSLDPETAKRLAADVRARLDRLHAADPAAFRFRPPFATVLASK